jgi:hypothetical protein
VRRVQVEAEARTVVREAVFAPPLLQQLEGRVVVVQQGDVSHLGSPDQTTSTPERGLFYTTNMKWFLAVLYLAGKATDEVGTAHVVQPAILATSMSPTPHTPHTHTRALFYTYRKTWALGVKVGLSSTRSGWEVLCGTKPTSTCGSLWNRRYAASAANAPAVVV